MSEPAAAAPTAPTADAPPASAPVGGFLPRIGDPAPSFVAESTQGEINFPMVKQAIDEIGYTGWLIIEGATVRGRSVADCYRDNQKYLRSIFPTKA